MKTLVLVQKAHSTLPALRSFARLVSRVIATGIHEVEDLDRNPIRQSEEITRRWVTNFGGTFKTVEVEEVRRCFEGDGHYPHTSYGGA